MIFPVRSGSLVQRCLCGKDNRAVIPGDYSTYEGLRIGLVEDNAQNKDIANLAEAMHFNYQPVIYKSIKDVWVSPSKKVRSMPS